MRHVMCFALLCVGMFLVGCSDSGNAPSSPSAAVSTSETPDAFTDKALQAARSGELDKLVAMVKWEGVPESVKVAYMEELSGLVTGSVDSVTFRAIAPEDILSYEAAGQTFTPVLPPVGWARFNKRSPSGETEWTELLIGKQGDTHRFAPAAPVAQ